MKAQIEKCKSNMASLATEKEFKLQNLDNERETRRSDITKECERKLKAMDDEISARKIQIEKELERKERENAAKLTELEDTMKSLKLQFFDEEPSETQTLSVAECPVCLNQLLPPLRIFMCGEGHVVCSDCKPSLHNTCPECRQTGVIWVRCIAMERMIAENC